MFRGSRIDRRILLVPALSALISVSAPAITLPPGFSDNLVAAVGAPTALAFTPDGRLLITSQGGDLRVVTPGDALLGTQAFSLGARVCSNSERGLLGVAVDPVMFNKNNAGCPTSSQSSPVERVSRFRLPDTNVIDPASELVLVDNVLNFAGNHDGGDVRFGTDGYLYASIGDGGCDYAGDSGCGGANDASRDRNILERKDPQDREGRPPAARQPVPGRGHGAVQHGSGRGGDDLPHEIPLPRALLDTDTRSAVMRGTPPILALPGFSPAPPRSSLTPLFEG